MIYVSALLFLPVIYCVARASQDARDRRAGWAVAGFVTALLTLTLPIAVGVMTLDLPN